MCMSLPACVSAPCTCLAPEEARKWASDPLELELKSDLGLLEERQGFLITEPCLQRWGGFYVEILADIHKQ